MRICRRGKREERRNSRGRKGQGGNRREGTEKSGEEGRCLRLPIIAFTSPLAAPLLYATCCKDSVYLFYETGRDEFQPLIAKRGDRVCCALLCVSSVSSSLLLSFSPSSFLLHFVVFFFSNSATSSSLRSPHPSVLPQLLHMDYPLSVLLLLLLHLWM